MTAQAHEGLILNGEETSMACCPRIPFDNSEIFVSVEGTSIVITTSCWRNYIGKWEIKDKKLYLLDVDCQNYKLIAKPPIFAKWFTGMLRIPQGNLIKYIHMGYGSHYEKEIFIEIEKGNVIDSKTFIINEETLSDELLDYLKQCPDAPYKSC
jgi:hypothetical protein